MRFGVSSSGDPLCSQRRFPLRRLVQYRLRTLLIATALVAAGLTCWMQWPKRVSFQDLVFSNQADLEAKRSNTAMPTWRVAALHGKTVQISGFMLPSYRNSEKQFIFVPDMMLNQMRFGPHETIAVTLLEGTEVDFTVRSVNVTGRFEISRRHADVGVYYAIQDARVEGSGVVTRAISLSASQGTCGQQRP